MGGRIGSNRFTGGGGKGAGCVFILLMILEAAVSGLLSLHCPVPFPSTGFF